MADLTKAGLFNASKAGVLWNVADLPPPLNQGDPKSAGFCNLVLQFQILHGLMADGMLGSATLSAMREVDTSTDLGVGDGQEDIPNVVPPRLGCSNHLIANGKKIPVPAGVSLTNYLEDKEVHFAGAQPRGKKVQHLVFHESVSRDAPSTIRILKGRNLGVHLVLAPDGHISQHCDVVTEKIAHGNQLNGSSIGFEIVNPYTGGNLRAPFTNTLPAQWWTWVPKDGKELYTTPTESQLKTLAIFVPWLCGVVPDLPYSFPTADLNATNQKIANWDAAGKPAPGIVAHRDYSSHADGRYPLEWLIRNKPTA